MLMRPNGMIPIVEIIRLEESEQWGTIGVLKVQKEVVCWTLEPPDRLNAPNRSSIPAQQYTAIRYNSPTFGETFMVTNVPGRSHILFHTGNTAQDTHGCIILGSEVGYLKSTKAVLESRKAFHTFMALMEGHDRFHLTVKEDY